MSEPCIITVAITGSVPRKKDTPAVPVTVAEQVESTQEAYEAGAGLEDKLRFDKSSLARSNTELVAPLGTNA